MVENHTAGGERLSGLEALKSGGNRGHGLGYVGHRQRGQRRATVPRQGGTGRKAPQGCQHRKPPAPQGPAARSGASLQVCPAWASSPISRDRSRRGRCSPQGPQPPAGETDRQTGLLDRRPPHAKKAAFRPPGIGSGLSAFLDEPRAGHGTSDADVEANRRDVTERKLFGFSHYHFQRNDITPIFREERRRPGRRTDCGSDRDHSPTIGRGRRDFGKGTAFGRGDGHEVVWRRAAPEPDLAAEFEFHAQTITGWPRFFDCRKCASLACR